MKAEYPKVSICLVTYQQKQFVKEAIESVLLQDYPNMEIVVGDDGSTDGTQELLKKYEQRHPDVVKLILAPHNTGITENCNRILKACCGKYIAFLGGDDLMLPGKIKTQVDYMERHPECSICYHNLEVFDSDTGEILNFFNGILHQYPHEGGAADMIRFGTFNGAASTMVRKSDCPRDGFDTEITHASDWLFWVETLINGREIHYIDQVLGRYRRHRGNITLQSSVTYMDHLKSVNIILSRYPQYKKDALYRKFFLYIEMMGLKMIGLRIVARRLIRTYRRIKYSIV